MRLPKQLRAILLVVAVPVMMGDACPEPINCAEEYATCETNCANKGGIGTFVCEEGGELSDGTEMLPVVVCICADDLVWQASEFETVDP